MDTRPVQLQDRASDPGHQDVREQFQESAGAGVLQQLQSGRLTSGMLFHGPARAMPAQGERRGRLQGRSVGAGAHTDTNGQGPPRRRLQYSLQVRLQRSDQDPFGIMDYCSLRNRLFPAFASRKNGRDILIILDFLTRERRTAEDSSKPKSTC